MSFLGNIGRIFIDFLAHGGRLVLFIWACFRASFSPPFYFRQFFTQLFKIGYLSLPVVGLTALFTGAVLALQIYVGSSRFNGENLVSSIVALGIIRELGPALAGLMVAGRISSSIAAELGTMRVTEQIDALSTLATNPFQYLVIPRVLAATFSLPLLVLVADTIGVMGGYIVGTRSLGFDGAAYLKSTVDFITLSDITSGLLKSAVFGFIIAIMGAYHGFFSRGGAQGVGRATTNAVVSASIFILCANYLMTSLLFNQAP